MATARQLADRIKSVIPQLETETARIIQRSQPIIELKQDEFSLGEAPDGSRIGFYRNRGYRSFKLGLNPLAGGSVDLRLTGSFYRGLLVEATGSRRFLFDSNDDKAPSLFAKYGEDLRGLSDRRWMEAQRLYVAPELAKFIKRQLGL